MEVTAWNNGKHHATGAGYGFKVNANDRDKHFERSWKTVLVSLPGVERQVEVNIAKSSFWSDTCRELISREFGRWLLENNYAPWPSGAPPKFQMHHTSGNQFRLERTRNITSCSSRRGVTAAQYLAIVPRAAYPPPR
jgi:hypothetical protein